MSARSPVAADPRPESSVPWRIVLVGAVCAAAGGVGFGFRVCQPGAVPFEEDFAPDVEALNEAVSRLVELRGAPGSPHVDPEIKLDLPAALPKDGLGGRAALEALAGPALSQASRLDHPGFFAPWIPRRRG